MNTSRSNGGTRQGGAVSEFGQRALGFSRPETGVKPPCLAPSLELFPWRFPKGGHRWYLVRPNGTYAPHYPEADGLPGVEVYLREFSYKGFLNVWIEALRELKGRPKRKRLISRSGSQQPCLFE